MVIIPRNVLRIEGRLKQYRVDPDNKSVIEAVDFVGVDEYPYWQGATMEQAPEVFWSTYQEVIDATLKVKVCLHLLMPSYLTNSNTAWSTNLGYRDWLADIWEEFRRSYSIG